MQLQGCYQWAKAAGLYFQLPGASGQALKAEAPLRVHRRLQARLRQACSGAGKGLPRFIHNLPPHAGQIRIGGGLRGQPQRAQSQRCQVWIARPAAVRPLGLFQCREGGLHGCCRVQPWQHGQQGLGGMQIAAPGLLRIALGSEPGARFGKGGLRGGLLPPRQQGLGGKGGGDGGVAIWRKGPGAVSVLGAGQPLQRLECGLGAGAAGGQGAQGPGCVQRVAGQALCGAKAAIGVLQRGQCVQQTGIVHACLLAREGALGKVAGDGGREAVHACNQGGRHAGVQRLECGNRFMARLSGQRRRGGFARQAAIGLGLGLQPLLAFL